MLRGRISGFHIPLLVHPSFHLRGSAGGARFGVGESGHEPSLIGVFSKAQMRGWDGGSNSFSG